jgi:hypothetical protein
MANDNRVSIDITPAQLTAINGAVTALKTAFAGLLVNLTPEERRTLPKISDGTLAFHEKCTAYRAANPGLTPSFTNVAELAKDLKLVASLLPLLRALAPLLEGVEDTITLAYSDLYLADLAFYANVKVAAQRGVPGADTIFSDLKVRFNGKATGPAAPVTP